MKERHSSCLFLLVDSDDFIGICSRNRGSGWLDGSGPVPELSQSQSVRGEDLLALLGLGRDLARLRRRTASFRGSRFARPKIQNTTYFLAFILA